MNPTLLVSLFFTTGIDENYRPVELAILIVVPIVLSLILLKIAKRNHAKGARPWQLWVSLIPILFGIWMAVGPLKTAMDPHLVEFNMMSTRSVMLHYASFFVPVVAALAIVASIFYYLHRERMEQ